MSDHEKQIIAISTGTMIRAVAVGAGVWFLIAIHDVVGMLLVSVLLAALLNPIANFGERWKIPRTVSVLVTYIVLLFLLSVLLLAIIPPMIEQTREFIESFAVYWQKVVASFNALQEISIRYGLESNFQRSLMSIDAAFSGAFINLFSTISSVIGNVLSIFIIIVISFFLVVEKKSLLTMFHSVLPKRRHGYVTSLLVKIQTKVGMWMLGQIILMVFVGILSYVGLLIFKIPYALLLAVVAGVTEIIPYVGPVIGAIPAVFLACAESPTKGLIVFVLYFVIQRVENNILVPKIMQKTTGLNPVLAIVALAVGYQMAGVAGVLLAIPVATAGNVILTDYIERQNEPAHEPAHEI